MVTPASLALTCRNAEKYLGVCRVCTLSLKAVLGHITKYKSRHQ